MAMVKATWTFVESLGIPDSPMRKVLFDLATFMDDNQGSEDWTLASVAYTAMGKEFQELFVPKSPLQQQLDHLKVARELEEMIGVRIPEIPGEQFELRSIPETVDELSEELGLHDGGKAVREILRHAISEQVNAADLASISETQANYVRAHLPAKPII